MALTRKFLAALGIESEKIDEIISAHTDVTTALKEERDSYKAEAEKLPGVQKELDKLKEAADQNQDNPYKAQYEDLKREYDDYKADVEAKQTKANKTAAFKSLLKEIGVSEKRIDSIAKISDIDSLELDKDGKIKDADKKKDSLKDEWADFIVKEEKRGAEENNPPGNNGGGEGKSRAAEVAAKFYKNVYGGKSE